MKITIKKCIIICLILLLLFVLYIYLNLTGYILITNQSSIEMKKIITSLEKEDKINLRDFIEFDWDIAIILTNENELEMIEKYQNNGIISKDFTYRRIRPYNLSTK